VTKPEVRAATEDDLAAIAAVAEATGQVEEWSGSDPAYVRHLLAHGQVLVAEHRATEGRAMVVTGFGATLRIGDGPAAVTMLCDLFVDPGWHGRGVGQALLAALWEPGSPRMTFSSLHAHALPVYTRAGLDAWWPLLYLGGDVGALPRAPGWTIAAASPEEVSGPGSTGRPTTGPGPRAPADGRSPPATAVRCWRPAPWPARRPSTASPTWRCPRRLGTTGRWRRSRPCSRR